MDHTDRQLDGVWRQGICDAICVLKSTMYTHQHFGNGAPRLVGATQYLMRELSKWALHTTKGGYRRAPNASVGTISTAA